VEKTVILGLGQNPKMQLQARGSAAKEPQQPLRRTAMLVSVVLGTCVYICQNTPICTFPEDTVSATKAVLQ
jgi:hypothetical protein